MQRATYPSASRLNSSPVLKEDISLGARQLLKQ